jgi:hypothetical protein
MLADRPAASWRARSRPRVRVSVRVALVATVVLAAGAGARALWLSHARAEQNHTRAELIAAYERATAAVARIQFPPGIRREPKTDCGDANACGHSTLPPQRLIARLRQLVGGGQVVDTPACPLTDPLCPRAVAGRFRGFRIIAAAFWRPVLVLHGTPPRGVVAFRVGQSRRFFHGSDVTLDVVLPRALETG